MEIKAPGTKNWGGRNFPFKVLFCVSKQKSNCRFVVYLEGNQNKNNCLVSCEQILQEIEIAQLVVVLILISL